MDNEETTIFKAFADNMNDRLENYRQEYPVRMPNPTFLKVIELQKDYLQTRALCRIADALEVMNNNAFDKVQDAVLFSDSFDGDIVGKLEDGMDKNLKGGR